MPKPIRMRLQLRTVPWNARRVVSPSPCGPDADARATSKHSRRYEPAAAVGVLIFTREIAPPPDAAPLTAPAAEETLAPEVVATSLLPDQRDG